MPEIPERYHPWALPRLNLFFRSPQDKDVANIVAWPNKCDKVSRSRVSHRPRTPPECLLALGMTPMGTQILMQFQSHQFGLADLEIEN
jgi:hypothetical protein